MVNFFDCLQHIKSRYFALIANICHPNPKYFPQKGQLELCQQRYQANLHFFLLAAVICTIHLLIKKAPLMTYFMSLWICFSLIFLKILCCRLHPEFFKVLSNIFIGAYGLTLVWSDLAGVHRAWIATPLLQTVVLFCTGSTTHFLFQAIFQQTLMMTVYQKSMIKTVEFLTPEEFVRSLTSVSASLGATNIVVTFCVFAALQNANERIGAAEKKKEEFERQKIFLLGFSHELRNSINSLMGNVKLASLERISEKAQKFLQIADICGELLLHLINNILDTSKAQIGDLEINSEQTNIYDAMERIWSVCSEIIRRKNLQGRFVICTNMPRFLQVDHYRLMQVFLNVVGNAVKFTDRGEINVSVDWIENMEKVTDKSFEPYPFDEDNNDTSEGIFEKNQTFSCIDENFLVLNSSTTRVERKMLKYSKNMNKGILKVTVSDTGCGISKDNIDKLFQQFSQVSLDPSQRKLGTGLGLFITKELCERMGGDIKVFSKEGTGSCFSFCLPMTPVSLIISHGQNTEDSISSPRRQKSLKAMIVDDESFSQGILKNFFDRLQIDVVSIAENGLEAYTKYCDYVEAHNSPVVVTMDLTMPVMDGKKSAQKIRKFEQERGIRPCLLIVISGNCSESEIAQCLDKNGAIRANSFLKKPARPDDISRVISQYMARDDMGEH